MPVYSNRGKSRLVLAVKDVPFCNDKIGPGTPPIKTDEGRLTLYHFVDKDETRGKNGWEGKWQKRYSIGVMLLDLNDPSKIVGMSKAPLMVPEAEIKTSGGYRDNVFFPCGMIKKGENVRIYYNAGDAVVCLAECNIKELVALCKDKKKFIKFAFM